VAARGSRIQGATKMGRKMNILNEKNDVQHSTYIKLLSRMKENPINNPDYLKFVIPVRGGHFDY
jgi:hypothetical protein